MLDYEYLQYYNKNTMIDVNFNEIIDKNVSIKFENPLKQFWKIKNTYIQSVPKFFNNILYLHDCNAEYTLENGQKITVNSGAIVITPTNAKYKVTFLKKNENAFTIGINFKLYLEENEICIAKEPLIFENNKDLYLKSFFENIDNIFVRPKINFCLIYHYLYKIFDSLNNSENRNTTPLLQPAIDMLNSNRYDLTVLDLSQACHISTVYFSKLFKRNYCVSPNNFLIQRKINMAKLCLEYTDMNITEIAYQLEFADVSYFCKIFKRKEGVTPIQYKRLINK